VPTANVLLSEAEEVRKLSQIVILGIEGKTLLNASPKGAGKLFFEFELYARDSIEGDCEFNHTVEPEEFSAIALMFGLSSHEPVLKDVQQITDSRDKLPRILEWETPGHRNHYFFFSLKNGETRERQYSEVVLHPALPDLNRNSVCHTFGIHSPETHWIAG